MSKKKKNNQDQHSPYIVDKLASIPASVKIGFLKFWLVGATFYLIFYGLPPRFDFLDRFVVFTLILILGVEYLSNTIIYFMNTDKSDTLHFLPHEVRRRSIFSLLSTGLYCILVILAVHGILTLWTSLNLPTIGDAISESSADPISFGLLFLGVDAIWIKIRAFIKKKIRKEKS